MTRVSYRLFATILGLIAACTSTETSDSEIVSLPADHARANVAWADDACKCAGEEPALPSQICEDGTVAGPTCVATTPGACEWTVTECPDPQPTDCSASDCPTGQHCEVDCHPCDAPDPKTPCDSFTCQSTCVPD